MASGYSLVSRFSRGTGSRTNTWGNFRVRRVVVVTVFVSTHSLTSSWKRRERFWEPSEMFTETVCVGLGCRGSRAWLDGEGVMVRVCADVCRDWHDRVVEYAARQRA